MENTTIQTNSASNIAEKETEINENIVKKAVEKLDKEAVSVSGQNVPAIGIYQYLREKASKDTDFAKQVLIETKSLSKCFSYVMEYAYKVAQEQHNQTKETKIGVGMSDAEIYKICEEYFALDDAEIERKKKAEEEAKKKKAEEEKAKKEAEKETKKKAKTEKSKKSNNNPDESAQMSLL